MTTTAPPRSAPSTARTQSAAARGRGTGLLAAILILLPLIVSAAALAGLSLRSNERTTLAVESAVGLYNAGDFDLAVEAFRQMIDQGADAPAVYYGLGMAALQAGDARQAVDALEKAVAGSPREQEFARALEQARNRVSVEAASQGPLVSPALQPENGFALVRMWNRWLSQNETALVGLVAWCALAAMICVALRRPHVRLLAILGGVLAGVVLIASLAVLAA